MRQKRILLVEDNEDNRFILAHRLRTRGAYDVLEAADGLEALALLAQSPPDVMIMDLKMPRMNGWELLQRVRAMAEAVRTIPILALTAQSMEGDEQRLLAANGA